MQQPELTNDWGVPFYGKAETASGDVWWYTDDGGIRRTLLPVHPVAGTPSPVSEETNGA